MISSSCPGPLEYWLGFALATLPWTRTNARWKKHQENTRLQNTCALLTNRCAVRASAFGHWLLRPGGQSPSPKMHESIVISSRASRLLAGTKQHRKISNGCPAKTTYQTHVFQLKTHRAGNFGLGARTCYGHADSTNPVPAQCRPSSGPVAHVREGGGPAAPLRMGLLTAYRRYVGQTTTRSRFCTDAPSLAAE